MTAEAIEKISDLEKASALSDRLTDTRYLFEIISAAIRTYRDNGGSSEMFYLDYSMEVAMKSLRYIEDELAELTPLL